MNPEPTKDQVTGACTYAQWATANDLGFLLRHYIKPRGRRTRCLPEWDEDLRRWRHPEDVSVAMDCEFELWDLAGRPDGFGSTNISEYWSRLDPHVRAEDDLWKGLVAGAAQLRVARGADIFGAAYRVLLEAFVADYLVPANVKPAKK